MMQLACNNTACWPASNYKTARAATHCLYRPNQLPASNLRDDVTHYLHITAAIPGYCLHICCISARQGAYCKHLLAWLYTNPRCRLVAKQWVVNASQQMRVFTFQPSIACVLQK